VDPPGLSAGRMRPAVWWPRGRGTLSCAALPREAPAGWNGTPAGPGLLVAGSPGDDAVTARQQEVSPGRYRTGIPTRPAPPRPAGGTTCLVGPGVARLAWCARAQGSSESARHPGSAAPPPVGFERGRDH